jgi:hypothetical protein
VRGLVAAAVAWLMACALVPPGADAAWNQPSGSSLNVSTASDAANPSIANLGGVPYVGWAEGNPAQAYVKRLDGSSWSIVGSGSLNISPSRSALDVNVASVGGTPYVAWSETNGTAYQLYVKRLDGSAWVSVGSGSLNVNASQNAFIPEVADVGGTPYVVWEESNGAGLQIYVKRFDGNSWVGVGGGSLNIDPTKNANTTPSITTVGGAAYVAWSEYNGAMIGQVHVKRFDGSSWVSVGSSSLNVDATKNAFRPSISNVGGVPYIAWDESNGTAAQIYVKRFDGSSWVMVGSGALNIDTTKDAIVPNLVSVGGNPLVGWQEQSGGVSRLYVKRFDGTGWNLVGGTLNVNPSNNAYFFSDPEIVDVGDVPYAVWQESDGTHTQIRLKRLEPDIMSESAVPTANAATLSAQINDFHVPLPIGFELGRTTAFGRQTPLHSSPGTGVSTITEQVSGLTPATSYFYRVFGSDTFRETSQGATRSFTTLALGPPALTKVTLTKVSQSHRRWREGSGLPHIATARPPVGTTFGFTLNDSARVRFVFKQRLSGRRVGGHCVAPTAKNRSKPRCTRLVSRGALSFSVKAGAHRMRFRGRLSKRNRLPIGRYTVLITATNSAGQRARAKLTFTIVT